MTSEKDQSSITIIDSTTVIKGNMKINNDCDIYGIIEGDIEASANVRLHQGGIVKGNLFSSYAEIAGEVLGDVEITGCLTLLETAVLNKKFKTVKLIIEDGAKF